jgi:hypothetical protein
LEDAINKSVLKIIRDSSWFKNEEQELPGLEARYLGKALEVQYALSMKQPKDLIVADIRLFKSLNDRISVNALNS